MKSKTAHLDGHKSGNIRPVVKTGKILRTSNVNNCKAIVDSSAEYLLCSLCIEYTKCDSVPFKIRTILYELLFSNLNQNTYRR